MEASNLEFFALVVLGVALVAYLVWQQAKHAGEDLQQSTDERMTAKAMQDAQERQEKRDAIQAADDYNQACSMEPFCGEGKKP